MRYKSSKMAVAARGPVTQSGRPDMRFKQNRTTGVNMNGTPDRRFAANKHLKKDGTPDMRYAENKARYNPLPRTTPAVPQKNPHINHNNNNNQQRYVQRPVNTSRQSDNIQREDYHSSDDNVVQQSEPLVMKNDRNDHSRNDAVDDESFAKSFQQTVQNDIMTPKAGNEKVIDLLMKYYVDGIVSPEVKEILSQTGQNQPNEGQEQQTETTTISSSTATEQNEVEQVEKKDDEQEAQEKKEEDNDIESLL